MINFFGLTTAWFMDMNLAELEWTKWPATMGFGTILYLIYNFYNSKRTNDKIDFDAITKQLHVIIQMQKEEIEVMRKEIIEKDELIKNSIQK